MFKPVRPWKVIGLSAVPAPEIKIAICPPHRFAARVEFGAVCKALMSEWAPAPGTMPGT